MSERLILGVDVGGTGIKAALVDMDKGTFASERHKIATPKPATPKRVGDIFAQLVEYFNYEGPIGCGFPSIVKNGTAFTASNIDESWIGTNVEEVFSIASGQPVFVTNDADAAGFAEVKFGKGKDKDGVVVLVTLGTGIGSAMFYNGQLIPNTEFGHFFLKNQKKVAERYAANSVRERKKLSWEEWGGRLNEYLTVLERITSPNQIILGGGISKEFDKYKQYIDIETPVDAAMLKNSAGIIGAAAYGYSKSLEG